MYSDSEGGAPHGAADQFGFMSYMPQTGSQAQPSDSAWTDSAADDDFANEPPLLQGVT